MAIASLHCGALRPTARTTARQGTARQLVPVPAAVAAPRTAGFKNPSRIQRTQDAWLISPESESRAESDDLLTRQRPAPEEVQPSVAEACTVHHGHASVRGLLKVDNQDRLVVLNSSQDQSVCASSDPTASNTTAAFCPPVDGTVTLSAVFDGHGGSTASSIAAERLHGVITADPMLWTALDTYSSNMHTCCTWDSALDQQVQQRWHSAFSRLDEEIINNSHASGKVDGTTVLAGIHSGLSLFIANAGDSRAVLGRGGNALRLTRDHTPDVSTERARIEACGGLIRHMKGCWRVLLPNRQLTQAKICSTSRGLGDADFKMRRLLTCEPEVTSLQLVPHLDRFSIFATDGVWSFVDDQSAVNAVQGVLDEACRVATQSGRELAELAASAVVKLALSRGSVDDISVVVHVYEWDGEPVDDDDVGGDADCIAASDAGMSMGGAGADCGSACSGAALASPLRPPTPGAGSSGGSTVAVPRTAGRMSVAGQRAVLPPPVRAARRASVAALPRAKPDAGSRDRDGW